MRTISCVFCLTNNKSYITPTLIGYSQMYCSVSITRPEHYIQLNYAKSCSSSSLRPSVPFTHNKNNMASKFTVGTSNTLGKVWNIDVEKEYRKLSYLFQNTERNNGIITESLRQLKMFIHQQSSTIMFHCFFGENLSDLKLPGR